MKIRVYSSGVRKGVGSHESVFVCIEKVNSCDAALK